MPDQLPPGPVLDERVCRALGWGQVLDMMLPGSFLGWPAVSTSGDVMLDAIDAMRERGYGVGVSAAKAGMYGAWFQDRTGHNIHGIGDTLPHAIALAILAALEPETSK